MMRDIKFRAFLSIGEWNNNGTEQAYEMCDDFASEEYAPVNDHLKQTENLMQYIGLKDKNGVEIYEGDVVSQSFINFLPQHFGEKLEIEQENIIGEVTYAKDCFRIKDANNKTLKEIMAHCEVIGNIYENPELLETK